MLLGSLLLVALLQPQLLWLLVLALEAVALLTAGFRPSHILQRTNLTKVR